MGLQVDLFIKAGVTPSLAEQLMEKEWGKWREDFCRSIITGQWMLPACLICP